MKVAWLTPHRLIAAGSMVCALSGPAWAQGERAPAPVAQDPAAQTCVGMVMPSVAGVEGEAAEIAVAVRDLFTTYLTGPAVKPIALDTRLASQAFAEAAQKACPNVLTARVTKKRRGGNGFFGQLVGQTLGSAAYQLPGAGSITGAVLQGAAVASAQVIAGLAASTKARDEFTLTYTLSTADGKARLGPRTEKIKASSDGQDVLTALVERAATALVDTLAIK